MTKNIPQNPFQDPELESYHSFLFSRHSRFKSEMERIKACYGSLRAYANLHTTLGVHKIKDASGTPIWRLREYMPNASAVWLTTDKLNFQRHAHYQYHLNNNGFFELTLPHDALTHGTYMELRVQADEPTAKDAQGRALRRVPAFAHWVEQDQTMPGQWCARLWQPEEPFRFKHHRPHLESFPRIYEAHVGMAQPALNRSAESVGSYANFTRHTLPLIRERGYTVVQLMGILEHPLYRSFGYQVSSYFAPSSRYGTPDEFKALVDAAHGLGLAVVLDIPHGHACPNTEQGLAQYDGSNYFFTSQHNQWGTPSFDFSQEMTRRFLLSNCRYWLEEFRVDGFRFDAVGNILYRDHGKDDDFIHVSHCFYDNVGLPRTNADGELYLCMANTLIHHLCPTALSIAEEFSGMPGLTCQPEDGGLGFDYRFAMGIPDYWAKCIEKPRDMGSLWYEMTNYRPYDRTISYVECHDQCINGEDAMIWRLLGNHMYSHMAVLTDNWRVSRGLAFYRLMRFITLATADAGYLNFMGNEFGHPEWLDAEAFAHRQWHLAQATELKYSQLAAWDKAQMHELVRPHLESFCQKPLFRFIHEEKRLLAFERGQLLFVFNFHELEAQKALTFAVTPGKYVEMMSSDERRFGGHGNLDAGGAEGQVTEHFTTPIPDRQEGDIHLYLPPLVGLALVRKK